MSTPISPGMNANSPSQLEKYSLPMSYYFQMECRRWAPTCDVAGLSGLLLVILMDVGLTGWTWSTGICRDAGMSQALEKCTKIGNLTASRIVEYATREQAQQAVTTLSNQNLMGRLVYVREVCMLPFSSSGGDEPRFTFEQHPLTAGWGVL